MPYAIYALRTHHLAFRLQKNFSCCPSIPYTPPVSSTTAMVNLRAWRPPPSRTRYPKQPARTNSQRSLGWMLIVHCCGSCDAFLNLRELIAPQKSSKEHLNKTDPVWGAGDLNQILPRPTLPPPPNTKRPTPPIANIHDAWSVIRSMQICGAPLIAIVTMLDLAVNLICHQDMVVHSGDETSYSWQDGCFEDFSTNGCQSL